MYRVICTFGLFFLSGLLISHNRSFAQKNDTLQIIRLMDSARTFLYKDNKKAEMLYRESIRKSETQNYYKGIGRAWKAIGSINMHVGRYQLAIENTKKAIQYYRKAKAIRAITSCYDNIGICYSNLGQTDSAIIYFMEGINNFPSAAIYHNAAVSFQESKNYSKAIVYNNKAIDLAKSSKDSVILIAALADQGAVYSALNNYKQASVYLRKALSLSKQISHYNNAGVIYSILSQTYLKMQNADSTIAIAKKGIELSELTGNFDSYIQNTINLSDGLKLKKRHAERIPILLKALRECQQNKYFLYLDDIYLRLGDAYQQQSSFKESNAYLLKYIAYTDSALNEKSNRTVAELEVKYQTAQKEKTLVNKQLELSQKDLMLQKSRQYTYLISGVLAVVVVLIGMLFLYFKANAQEQQKKVQLMEQQREIEVLHSVMEQKDEFLSVASHELKTPLTSIKASVQFLKQSIAKAPPTVSIDSLLIKQISM